MSRKPMNLTNRVAAVFHAVKKLERRGRNQDGDYNYTRATDVFEEVRERLFRQGILLHRDEDKPEYVDKQTNGGDWLQECRLRVTYWFSDGTEKTEPEHCNGVARKLDDKALYVAQTGADKAFLKRKGLMAEVIDDPEFDGQSTSETIEDAAPRRTSRKEQPLRPYHIDNIREAMVNTGKTEEDLARQVAAVGHADTLENVKQKYFRDLFRWAADGQGTIHAPKPQAVAAQPSLPLRTAAQPIEMKIGNKSIEFPAKDKAFSV